MSFRDILAVVTSQVQNEHVIAFAERFTSQMAGRLAAAVVNWQPSVAPVDGFVVDPLYGQLVVDARAHLGEEAGKLKARLAKAANPATVESYLVEFGAAGSVIGLRARHADVCIVARPSRTNKEAAQAILEAALFESGRPVIIVPPEWKGSSIGKHILFAWKPTREAARALADADELILGAERVSVVTVDARLSRGYGEQPGADIAAHLAYRGAAVDLINLDSGDRSETDAILGQALAVGADLIVMGGYGRPRLSEFIFGGVTREILQAASIPILMAH
ncbi:MAG: universal stress protein [Hyphomonadaceae bacterium]|nr:universal stress protein [Hyphomonadaceae bacterium]